MRGASRRPCCAWLDCLVLLLAGNLLGFAVELLPEPFVLAGLAAVFAACAVGHILVFLFHLGAVALALHERVSLFVLLQAAVARLVLLLRALGGISALLLLFALARVAGLFLAVLRLTAAPALSRALGFDAVPDFDGVIDVFVGGAGGVALALEGFLKLALGFALEALHVFNGLVL